MSGTFNIHPTGSSSLTCSLCHRSEIGDASVNYQILERSLKLKEAERRALIDAGAERDTVEIEFMAFIVGTTQSDAIANMRTFMRALVNSRGGYIEYKPRGLGAGVLSTYLEYAQSTLPTAGKEGAITDVTMREYEWFGDVSGNYFIVLDCKVKVYPWASSDPDSPYTIISQTTIDNTDDGTHDNFLDVDVGEILGDALLPLIEIESSDDIDRILVHKRRMRDGANTNYDWRQAETAIGGGDWSNQVDASYSGGSYCRSNAASADAPVSIYSGMDTTYLGKASIIISAFILDSSEFDVYFKVFVGDADKNVDISRTVHITGLSEPIVYEFGEVDFPPADVEGISDADIATYIQDLGARIVTERTTGSGYINVDWILFAKADEFLAMFEGVDEMGTIELLCINALRERAEALNGDVLQETWKKYGSPFSRLRMDAGYDYRFRFIGWRAPLPAHNPFDELDVTIKGIHLTVYPFGETPS